MSEMSVIDNIRLTFLYIEFYSMGKTWVYPESYIPYNIFRYIVKGKAEFCIDGEEIIVKENQIVYIPQGCRMSCRALSESFEFYSLRFTTSVFYEGEDVLKEYYGIPRIIENEGEDYYFKEICKWVKKDSWVKKCFVRGYLDLLIGTLSMRVNKFDKNTGKVTEKNENPVLKIAKRKEQIDSRVQLVADYVVLHPREKYTPQKMAEMVELSKQRFSSLFKANMGKSPMEYVREIRLTTAARALLVSNKNINDIGFTGALAINRVNFGKGIYRTLMIIPWAFPSIVIALSWKWILNGVSGFIPNILVQLGICNELPQFLSDNSFVFLTLIFINIWFGAPMIMVNVLSALQTIPQDQYEAAQIDGASKVQQFWYITVPHIKVVVGLLVVLRTIWVFNNFDIIYLLTGGGPANATTTMPIYAYNMGWNTKLLGRSSAVTMLLLAFLLLVCVIYFTIIGKWEKEDK